MRLSIPTNSSRPTQCALQRRWRGSCRSVVRGPWFVAPSGSSSGSVLTEAAIGIALMTFVWIMISYTMFMATNDIRTEMAARYAAWYRGASGNAATSNQVDQAFFYQSGLSKVEYGPGEGIGDLLSSGSGDTTTASKYSGDANGPFMAKVTFGVSSPSPTNQFPFDLLITEVPFMPNSYLTNCLSINSTCQWDGDSDTWKDPGQAANGILDSLKNIASQLFPH